MCVVSALAENGTMGAHFEVVKV
jgi:hypothetical protein